MRRRGVVARVLTGLCALWLGVLVTEPVPVHRCAMHRAAAPVGEAPTGHAHHQGGAPAGQSAPEQAPCSCLGHGCASSFVALGAKASVTVAVTVAELARAVPAPVPALLVPRHAARRLPFSNGPPDTRVS